MRLGPALSALPNLLMLLLVWFWLSQLAACQAVAKQSSRDVLSQGMGLGQTRQLCFRLSYVVCSRSLPFNLL